VPAAFAPFLLVQYLESNIEPEREIRGSNLAARRRLLAEVRR
jgi:hypothetical protein